jgi:hypothetical protein
MNRSRSHGFRTQVVVLAAAMAAVCSQTQVAAQFALDTRFTYQGRLQHDGAPAHGRFDLSFELFDALQEGRSLGRIDTFDRPVRQGAFAAELDFGHSVYSGDPVWLEIQVRAAGDGAYTVLRPRHRLAGEGIGTCTVNSDILINGTLDIDPVASEVGLEVACCNEATPAGGGQIALAGNAFNSLLLDSNEVQATVVGTGGNLFLNPGGGNVAVGSSLPPQAPLHVPTTPDVEPGSGGGLVTGPTAANNLAFDGNEIMARDNGSVATLFLNADGGDVVIGGHLDIGATAVTLVQNSQIVVANCPPGTFVLTGLCEGGNEAILISGPQVSSSWTCVFSGPGIHAARAVCGRLRW